MIKVGEIKRDTDGSTHDANRRRLSEACELLLLDGIHQEGDDHEEDDEEVFATLSSLISEYQNLDKLTYSNRVSVVNKDEIVNSLDKYYGVLALTPESSREALRSTKSKIVLNEIYGASFVSLDSLISLHYDWKKIISEYLKGGSISFYYTFSVLH